MVLSYGIGIIGKIRFHDAYDLYDLDQSSSSAVFRSCRGFRAA
jgi:hypothetical protein